MKASSSQFAVVAALLLTLIPSLGWAGETWNTDYAEATETAASEEKMVLLNFTGSDWCPPCEMLHSEVLTKDAFKKFADEKLVLVELDFPNDKPQSDALKKQNADLSETYGIEGYPTLILLDSEGKEVKREVGLAWRTPEDLITWIEG